MEEHADYDGPSITWGLDYKLASAAQCCQACKDVRARLMLMLMLVVAAVVVAAVVGV